MIVKTMMLFASFSFVFSSYAQKVSDSAITVLEKVTVKKEVPGYKVNEPSLSLRIITPLIQLPQNIQAVSSKLISDQQISDMSDGISRNMSGTCVSVHEGWGNYVNLLMRGGRITPFRNGINVKMPWGPLTEDMCMIERIEFVKGPAGFMFANGDPTALYNVVTKKPTGTGKGEVSVTVGSFDLYRTTVDVEGKLNKAGNLLYRLNVMGQAKNSHRKFDFNNRYAFAPVITCRINDKTLLTAEYTYQQMKMAMLGAANLFSLKMGDLPGNFSITEGNLAPTTIRDDNLLLMLDHRLTKDLKVTAKIAYLHYMQTGSTVWPAYPGGLHRNGDLLRSISNWDALSESRIAQSYISGKAVTGPVNHFFLAGFDVSYKNYYADFYQSSNISAYDNSGNSVAFNIYNPIHGKIPLSALPQFDRTRSLKERGFGTLGESVSSFYIQDELHIADDRVRVTMASRYTRLLQHSFDENSYDNRITPRIGVSVNLYDAATAYTLFDCSFVGQQGTDSAGHPFKPLTGSNVEAGIKKDWFDAKLNTTISVYRVTRNNIITYLPGPVGKAVQKTQTKTKGVEFDLKGDLGRRMGMVINYAFTRSVVSRGPDQARIGNETDGPGFPEHIANAWINFKIADKWNVFAGYQWQGARQHYLPDYHRADAGISYRTKNITTSLNVNNLADKYLYSGAPYEFDDDAGTTEYYFQVEPGVNFRFSVAYRF